MAPRARKTVCARVASERGRAGPSTQPLDFAMRTLLFLLAVLPSIATAADFRVIDIGGPCNAVRGLEEAQGSVSIPWKHVEGADLQAFRGWAFDREVSILYLCRNGRLYSGTYFLPPEHVEQALASYDRLYDALVASYGQPFYTPPGAEAHSITADPKKRSVSWDTARVYVHLQLSSDSDADPQTWRAWLTILGSRDKAKSNQRLERPVKSSSDAP